MFDVIVIGAGPAGLSVGSELARSKRVLILDGKSSIEDCTKSWFIPASLVEGNDEVLPFMTKGINRLLCSTASGKDTVWETSLPGGYYYVDEHAILKFWGEKALDRGAEIILETYYTDHVTKEDRVVVETTKGRFEAKLLIDASGHDSQVKKNYKTDENYYWWSVYGAIVEHPNGLHGMENGDYMLWQTFKDTQAGDDVTLEGGRPVFEYEVLTENSSFPLILYLRKSKVQKDLMRTEFKHVLYNEDRTSQFKDAVIKEEKWGWYPSGDLTVKQAEDRVDFIGDAGCWTTPCGWGFGFIVYNYKHYAKSIEELLDKDRLDEASLKGMIQFNINEKHQILMDAIASHFLANGTPEQLDKFIDFFNNNEPLMCEKIFTLTISQEEIRGVAKEFVKFFNPLELLSIYPKEDWNLLLKEIPYFLADTIGEAVAKTKKADIGFKPAFDISDNKAYE
ncbi:MULTISPECIES: lycopene cyclase family protein [unclassified Fusibacter]|uniref:lycopene cyclase family protein n=1 Tax=unclassified Fusibacter TaxID=2624464 RepID=UPI0010131901|nr:MULTISPECIES: lycopene cyclase family protein [unclassified Fusibacter]MCK8059399.1 lycopene cyclase family protein [Fusibacter sp. A2]NPE21137.1 hypothetical protein [Fusibacter sp. A1]RXV62406.1 hypothetical protein DWB64_04825 [Fusibacter sp. A1]